MTKLFLITNRRLVKEGSFFSRIERAVAGGIDSIILREKDLSYEELLPIAKEIKDSVKKEGTQLIVNANLEVAEAISAEGYHIGYETFMKNKPSFDGLVGVSVHSLEEAIEAEKQGANYLLASHVFETNCKAGLEPKGLAFIELILSRVKIPVIALGGINLENVRSVVSLGVEGIAIMSGIMEAEDPYRITQAFKEKMK